MRAVWVRVALGVVVVTVALAVAFGVGWRVPATQDPSSDDPLYAADASSGAEPAVRDESATQEPPAPSVEPPPPPTVPEVTEALSTAYGMSFDAGPSGQDGRRSVQGHSFDPSTGVEVECVVWSVGEGAAERVVLIEAECRAPEDPEALETVATEYLGFCAQLAMDGAGADSAQVWVAESAAAAYSGGARTTEIEGVRLELHGEPGILRLVVEIG